MLLDPFKQKAEVRVPVCVVNDDKTGSSRQFIQSLLAEGHALDKKSNEHVCNETLFKLVGEFAQKSRLANRAPARQDSHAMSMRFDEGMQMPEWFFPTDEWEAMME